MKKKASSVLTSKQQKIKSFDPNGVALKDANIFGLPFTSEEAEIVLIPVPWEVTVSYGGGTGKGPAAILEASGQVDLFHPEFPGLWSAGISMEPVPEDLYRKSKELKKAAARVIEGLSEGKDFNKEGKLKDLPEKINSASEEMVDYVKKECSKWLAKGKLVGLVGGDHSTPLGFFQALADKYNEFGILQIDAHMDLRKAYEGFEFSHASIMFNTLKLKQVKKLVQVGIRDFCQEEHEYVKASKGRVKVFDYAGLAKGKAEGQSWKKQCEAIINALPGNVHISFDIDGLDPRLCPNTGTPVPGGFEFHEITYLLSALEQSGKKIISFDLNEVSPGEDDWDGNVGARMLFHLCGVLAKSQGRI